MIYSIYRSASIKKYLVLNLRTADCLATKTSPAPKSKHQPQKQEKKPLPSLPSHPSDIPAPSISFWRFGKRDIQIMAEPAE